MTVSKINSVSEVKTNTQNKAISPDKHEQKIDNKTGRILLISALTALAAGGIYLASRGRKVSNLTKVENKASGNLEYNKSNIEKQVKEMAIDSFKKEGNKFIKGKAKLAKGEYYTGELTHRTKDGRNITLEYKDGILQKVSDAEHIKEYHYDEDGKISDILKDNTIIYNKTSLIKDRYVPMTCVETSKSKIYIDADTKKIRKLIEKNPLSDNYVYRLFDENGVLKHFIILGKEDGRYGGNKFISYYPDGKNKQLEITMDVSPFSSDFLGDCCFYDKQGILKEKIKYMPFNGIFSPSGIYVYDGVKVILEPEAQNLIKYELSDIATGKMKALIDRNWQEFKKISKIDLCLTDLFVDDKHFRRTEIEDGGLWKPLYFERKKDGKKVKISPESELYNKLLELENQYLSEAYSKIRRAEILLSIIQRQESSRRIINLHYSS